MGTTGELQQVVAGWRKDDLSSWEKFFAAYRREGVHPTQKRGGGKNSVHLSGEQYVLLILGMPASGPSDAVATARRYASLHCQGSEPAGLKLPGGQLIDILVETLDVYAVPLSKGESIGPRFMKNIKSWELILCDDPFVAYIVTNNEENGKETYFFHSDPLQWGAMHRMTMFSGDILLDLGRMLSETYIHRARQEQIRSMEENRPSRTRQRPESAGDLRQEGPPAPSENPTRVNGSEGSPSAPEGNNDGNSSQGHPVNDAS